MENTVEKTKIVYSAIQPSGTITLGNYAVSDYLEFDEPVLQYFIAGENEFVKLESGLYQL